MAETKGPTLLRLAVMVAKRHHDHEDRCLWCGKPWPCVDYADARAALDAYVPPPPSPPETPASEGSADARRLKGIIQSLDLGKSNRNAYVSHAMLCRYFDAADAECDCGYAEIASVMDECSACPAPAAEDGLCDACHGIRPASPASAPSRGTDHDPGEMDCTCIAPHPACPNCNGTGRYQR